MSDTVWYIIPCPIIDRQKYKGRGRPRNADYRIYPGEQDFALIPPVIVTCSLSTS